MENSSDEIKPGPKAVDKINLYCAAMYLYSIGKSHPQIVKILSEYSYDNILVIKIVDKAMYDEWDKLSDKARILLASGETYENVSKQVALLEEDKEVAEFIVKRWYNYKTEQINSIIESPTNIAEGSQWVIISGIALTIFFLLNFSIFTKILWSILFIGSLAQWILGLQQRKLANIIKKIFESDEQY